MLSLGCSRPQWSFIRLVWDSLLTPLGDNRGLFPQLRIPNEDSPYLCVQSERCLRIPIDPSRSSLLIPKTRQRDCTQVVSGYLLTESSPNSYASLTGVLNRLGADVVSAVCLWRWWWTGPLPSSLHTSIWWSRAGSIPARCLRCVFPLLRLWDKLITTDLCLFN